jgi:hypothetical protein
MNTLLTNTTIRISFIIICMGLFFSTSSILNAVAQHSGAAISGNAIGQGATSGTARSGNAVGQGATSGQAISGNATTGNATTGNATNVSGNLTSNSHPVSHKPPSPF